MADDQESWPDRPSTVGEGSGIGGDTGVDINWDWDSDLGLFDPYQEEIDENQVQPPAQQSAHAPMQLDAVPTHPSSHTQPHASGNSYDFPYVNQQQTGHEHWGFTPDWDISNYNDHSASFTSVYDSQTLHYAGELPSASGQPAQTYQQPLPSGQSAHMYQQSLTTEQPTQTYHQPSLAQPPPSCQQPLPITEQHIQPYGLSSPELVGLFQGYGMPSHAGQVTQSDSPVQPTRDLSQRHYLHQQSSKDLFPKPGQPTQGLGQPEPGAGSLRTPLSNQPEGHVVTPIRPFSAPHQIESSPISAQVPGRQSMPPNASQSGERVVWPLGTKIDVVKRLESGKRNGGVVKYMSKDIAIELGISKNTILGWWQRREGILLEEQKLNVIKYIQEGWTNHRDEQGSVAAAAHHFGVSTDTVAKWWDEREDPGKKDDVIRFIQGKYPKHGVLTEASRHFGIPLTTVRNWWTAAATALGERDNPEEEYDTGDMEGIENVEDREGQLQRLPERRYRVFSDEKKDEVIRFIQERHSRRGVCVKASRHFGIQYRTVAKWWAAEKQRALEWWAEEKKRALEERNLEDRLEQLRRELGTFDGEGPSCKPGEPSAT